jgi:tyrosine aminotransferase
VLSDFGAAQESTDAIKMALDKETFSYTVSSGLKTAREAVAKYVNKNDKEFKVEGDHLYEIDSEDVILASGCSTALEICFRAIANPGENILVPRPSWSYSTWMDGAEILTKNYNLDCTRDWEVDLVHMESQIDDNTRAILINNPGNPCGNVFSREHILDILKIAERHRLPIIADEVYEFFTFPGVKFHSFSSLSRNVPILSCSGLTKRFIMPGVRMGWLVIHDRCNHLTDVRKGLLNIAGRNFWPNSTMQLALPDILENTPTEFLNGNAERVCVSFLSF